MIQFIVEHWDSIIAVLAAVLSIAAIVVKMTPTKKDDEILEKILEIVREVKIIRTSRENEIFSKVSRDDENSSATKPDS